MIKMKSIFKKRIKSFYNDSHLEYIEFRKLTLDDFHIDPVEFLLLTGVGVENIDDLTLEHFEKDGKYSFPNSLYVRRKWILKFELSVELNSILVDREYDTHTKNEDNVTYVSLFGGSRYFNAYRPSYRDGNSVLEAITNGDAVTYLQNGGLRMYEFETTEVNYKGCRSDESRLKKLKKQAQEAYDKFHQILDDRYGKYLADNSYHCLDYKGSSIQGMNHILEHFSERYKELWSKGVKLFCKGATLKSWAKDEQLLDMDTQISDIDEQIAKLKENKKSLEESRHDYKKNQLLDLYEKVGWNFSGVQIPEHLSLEIMQDITSNGLKSVEADWSISEDDLAKSDLED